MRTAKATVFNLSFGQERPNGVRFSWRSQRLSALLNKEVQFHASLVNDADCLKAEKELANYHSIASKQDLGHNPRATAPTGWISVDYEDFEPDLTYRFVEDGNLHLSEVVAPILSFLQRRRVLFKLVKFTSSKQLVIAMPPFLAGEWIDSVAFGPEAIQSTDLEGALVTSLTTHAAMDGVSQRRIGMLLSRYNEILNLPYIHERVESLWRIVEAVGRVVPSSQLADNEYRRFLQILQIRKSENLQLLIAALAHYSLPYTDDEVLDSRTFRNHVMHEYLDPALQNWPSLTTTFHFLQRCVDRIIWTDLGLSGVAIQDAAYSVIQNRVL